MIEWVVDAFFAALALIVFVAVIFIPIALIAFVVTWSDVVSDRKKENNEWKS